MKIPFSPPDISEAEITAVAEALRSGWITTGPRTKELEKKIAAFVGASRCACLNSQTACAEMALRLLGIGPGDEVITCAYTYTATAEVVCHVGAKLVLVDTLPDTVEMDYAAMERAITPRTKAVIPVDLGGVPCNYEAVLAAVRRQKAQFTPANDLQKAIGRVAVVCDTAHALGARWHDRPVGSIADFSAFSFHAVKNFTTAEGGALTWNHIDGVDDEALYHQVQLMSLHGQSKDAFAKDKLGAWEYDVIAPWFKCNMTDIAAAMGLAQFERYPAMLRRRHEIVRRYDEALRPLGVRTMPHVTGEYVSSGHLYLTRVPGITPEQRGDIIEEMAQRGIATNVHYKPLPLLTAYKNLGFDIKDYPNAYAYFANEITLPLHTRLTDEDVAFVIENYTEVIAQYLP